MSKLELSTLGHTWIIDIDGSIVKHNGYLSDEGDVFLEGAKDFLLSIPPDDMIIFVSSRSNAYLKETEEFFKKNGIRYDYIIFDAPYGERIIINDNKPSGLKTGIAINLDRDKEISIDISLNDLL